MATNGAAPADARRAQIAASIRVIPDFPKKGIMFQDVSTLLLDPAAFQAAVDIFVERYKGMNVECVAGFEARGFVFGPPVALALKVPFVMLRKPNKLPGAMARCRRRRVAGNRRPAAAAGACTPI